MLHHIALCAISLEKSGQFYDAVLLPLGYSRTLTQAHLLVWQGPAPEILLYESKGKQRRRQHHTYDPGIHHIAFEAQSRRVVDQVGALLLQSGAIVLNAPQLYPDYSENYYAVFFLDPDGVKLEIMTEAQA